MTQAKTPGSSEQWHPQAVAVCCSLADSFDGLLNSPGLTVDMEIEQLIREGHVPFPLSGVCSRELVFATPAQIGLIEGSTLRMMWATALSARLAFVPPAIMLKWCLDYHEQLEWGHLFVFMHPMTNALGEPALLHLHRALSGELRLSLQSLDFNQMILPGALFVFAQE